MTFLLGIQFYLFPMISSKWPFNVGPTVRQPIEKGHAQSPSSVIQFFSNIPGAKSPPKDTSLQPEAADRRIPASPSNLQPDLLRLVGGIALRSHRRHRHQVLRPRVLPQRERNSGLVQPEVQLRLLRRPARLKTLAAAAAVRSPAGLEARVVMIYFYFNPVHLG